MWEGGSASRTGDCGTGGTSRTGETSGAGGTSRTGETSGAGGTGETCGTGGISGTGETSGTGVEQVRQLRRVGGRAERAFVGCLFFVNCSLIVR